MDVWLQLLVKEVAISLHVIDEGSRYNIHVILTSNLKRNVAQRRYYPPHDKTKTGSINTNECSDNSVNGVYPRKRKNTMAMTRHAMEIAQPI